MDRFVRRVSMDKSKDGSFSTDDEDDCGRVAEQMVQLSQDWAPRIDYSSFFGEDDNDDDSTNFEEELLLVTEQTLEKKKERQPPAIVRRETTDKDAVNDTFANIDEAELIRVTERVELQASSVKTKQPSESKRPPIKKQKKITDMFSTATGAGQPSTSAFPKNTHSRMHYNNKLYLKGDNWLPACPNEQKNVFKGMSVTLQRFDYKTIKSRRRPVAECHVYINLSETFVGPQEAQRLVQERVQKQLGIRNADKARCANTNMLEEGRYLPLRALSKRIEEPCPNPDLLWDAGPKETSGVGYNFAYRFVDSPTTVKAAPPLCRRPIVLDVFAGCGGMSQGFLLEGFHVRHAVDLNNAAAATLELNKKGSNCVVHNEDARVFLRKCKDDRLGMYPKQGYFDHIHLSPPCDGMSMANIYGGQNDDANNELTYCTLPYVEYFRPRTVSMENVVGMLLDKEDKKRIYLQKTVTGLLLLDYQVRVCIVSSADYGDAQARPRVFLLAARRDCKLPDLPIATHSKDGAGGTKRHVVVKDVLSYLENVEPVLGSGLVQLADKTCVWNHNRESTALKKPENMHRLVADKPANTVRRRNALQHYSLQRCLTIRERADLQSFPRDFKFCGTLVEQSTQIGNAVPINLARAMAKSIMNSYWRK